MELHDLWDHGLILEKTDPFALFVTNSADYNTAHELWGLGKLVFTEVPPTAENLAAFAFDYISNRLRSFVDIDEYSVFNDLILEKVVFYETPTSSATIDEKHIFVR